MTDLVNSAENDQPDGQDELHMRQAMQLAEAGRGQTSPNPIVGCVIVQGDRVVGQGAHLRAGDPHAEVHALRQAGDAARGGTAYVTLEPCSHIGRTPPCANALIQAGVERVVIGSRDPNPRVSGTGIARLQDAGIEVRAGVLATETDRQNEVFFTWVAKKRPFVVWKSAATLDGFVAASSGHSRFVTSDAARGDVQRLRAQLAGICVGVGTVLADDPLLTVRSFTHRQPTRVIVDSRLRTPLSARLLQEPGQTLIYYSSEESRQVEALQSLPNVTCVQVPGDDTGRCLIPEVLLDAADKGVDGLLLEGGPTLAGAFLQQRLIDKVVHYVAPKLLGGGLPIAAGRVTQTMAEAVALRDVQVVTIGEDIRIVGYPVHP